AMFLFNDIALQITWRHLDLLGLFTWGGTTAPTPILGGLNLLNSKKKLVNIYNLQKLVNLVELYLAVNSSDESELKLIGCMHLICVNVFDVDEKICLVMLSKSKGMTKILIKINYFMWLSTKTIQITILNLMNVLAANI
ncbi:hypothetical protein ACJX0J_029269, partial [Zea mays]